MLQTTIAKTITCTGIGLHSGKQVELTLRPASENTGIIFSFRNGSGSNFLAPRPELVVDTGMATTLGDGRDKVSTVEHLLAAVRGLGVDNVHIEAGGWELPIMDGSAASFVYLLHQAGIRKQRLARKVLRFKKPIVFEQDGKSITARPHEGFRLDYTIDFAHPIIGRQRLAHEVTPEVFETELSKARTFGFLREVEYLHANGLALGGSLENAVVLDEFSVLNPDGLRFEDEFVRHKMLDFVGDMAVMELPLYGAFEVFASGHGLNNQFLRYLNAHRSEYLEEIELAEPRLAAQPAVQPEREARPDAMPAVA
ncbi:MAG: UDP-3-O-acyl-N-acetylglucosamine deacetylase [Desulfovibrionaceae bacterium]